MRPRMTSIAKLPSEWLTPRKDRHCILPLLSSINQAVEDTTSSAQGSTQDGCDIFVTTQHASADYDGLAGVYGSQQHVAFIHPTEVSVETSHADSTHRYEFAFELGGETMRGRTLASTLRYMTQILTSRSPGWHGARRLGKSGIDPASEVCGSGPIIRFGRVRGTVHWEDPEEGTRYGKVRVESTDSLGITIVSRTDSTGRYDFDVPAGAYRVAAGYRRRSIAVGTVQVQHKQDLTLPNLRFPRPPMGLTLTVPAGDVRQAGPGRALRWKRYSSAFR